MKQRKKAVSLTLALMLAFALVFTACDTGVSRGRPSAPIVHVNEVTTTSIHLSWGASPYGPTEHRVERASSTGGPWTIIASTSSTQFTDTHLSPNTTMFYRVTRVVNGVWGSPSQVVSGTTRANGGGNQPGDNQPGTSGDPATTIAAQLDRLRTNASGSSYILYVHANESLAPRVLDSANLNGRSGITLRLRSIGSQHTVNVASTGALFTVGAGVTLILENNVILRGTSNNNQALVRVLGNGVFIMEGGEISGNRAPGYGGGGIRIDSGGTFTMRGGEITGNEAGFGAGVAVSGTFNMEKGLIRNNRATSELGGGVFVVSGGAFTMWDGEIDSNNGGGVHLGDGAVTTFTMHNGRITGNDVASNGGGVRLLGGVFTMNGGEISGNTVTNRTAARGGGVSVNPSFNSSATFNMTGGQIHSNTARGGIILQVNTIPGYGGGVYVSRNGGVFSKTGGSIQSNAVRLSSNDPALTNHGNQVFAGEIGSAAARRRENAVLDNLSFDGRTNPPTYSGSWD